MGWVEQAIKPRKLQWSKSFMSKINTGDKFTVNAFFGATVDCSEGTTYTARDTRTDTADCDGKEHDAIVFRDDVGDEVTAFIEKLTKCE